MIYLKNDITNFMLGDIIVPAMIKVLSFLFFVVVLITVSTALFVGAGYLLSFMFSLTLFQASVLCIGASFVIAFILFAITFDAQTFKVVHLDQIKTKVFDVDEGDNEFEKDVTLDVREVPQVTIPKVGRNEPCPCGSGKKYKFCCGRQ